MCRVKALMLLDGWWDEFALLAVKMNEGGMYLRLCQTLQSGFYRVNSGLSDLCLRRD